MQLQGIIWLKSIVKNIILLQEKRGRVKIVYIYIYIYPSEINISCIAFTGMSYINNLFNKHHVWCQYAIFFID